MRLIIKITGSCFTDQRYNYRERREYVEGRLEWNLEKNFRRE